MGRPVLHAPSIKFVVYTLGMDYRDPEDRKVLIDESALMKALDKLDELSPDITKEDWYHELSTAIDEHFKRSLYLRH